MPDEQPFGPAGLRNFIAWLLRRRPVAEPSPPAPPKPIQIAGSQPGWLRVLGADALLQTVHAQKAIGDIWLMSRFSRPVYDRDCLAPLRRYAEFVQLLPASEAHHHAHAGGLLSHTIEMLLAAMTWRNGRLLPEGAPIEVIDAQRDEWTLVVFYAALLHDIAKPLTDLRVTWKASNLEAVRWMPLAGSLPELAQGRPRAEYLVAFAPKVERDYSAHSRLALLLLQRMASPAALALLARQPAAFEALNRYLSGQDRDSLIAQIVRAADQASVQRALASGSRARFATAQAVPLVDLLMQSLRAMLRAGTSLPLNRSGAAGWVYDGALWLVAKRAADATREWILKHEPDETVPGETKNDRLFDTWQEYGCITPNPGTGQAIWYVTVHGKAEAAKQSADSGQGGQEAYAHSLSVLRFPLTKLFEDPGQYPPPMLGTIQVHDKRKDKDKEAEAETGTVPETEAVSKANQRQAEASFNVKQAPEAASGHGAAGMGKARNDKPEVVKAPTFNKPKSAQPVDAVQSKAMAEEPKTEAKVERSIEQQEATVKIGSSEDEYLLDETEAANPRALNREREQRLLAKAARQAAKQPPEPPVVATEGSAAAAPKTVPVQKPRQGPTTPAWMEQPARQSDADTRRILLQPVGGANRLLLQDEPQTTGRSAGQIQPRQPASGVEPVVLEPYLPRLPKSHDRQEREATASPVALDFIAWVQHSLRDRAIKFNETGAPVHFVELGMALVSPLIFKLFAATQVPESAIAEHAMQVQREVIKAQWHVPGANKTNILSFQVIGRGGVKAGKLAAVVLAEPIRFVRPVPPSNPALTLV